MNETGEPGTNSREADTQNQCNSRNTEERESAAPEGAAPDRPAPGVVKRYPGRHESGDREGNCCRSEREYALGNSRARTGSYGSGPRNCRHGTVRKPRNTRDEEHNVRVDTTIDGGVGHRGEQSMSE